jgi:hypothetical protein
MKTEELKELLKEAFESGRDYQYTINPYSGKPSIFSDNSDNPSFTKWVNAKFKLLGLHNVSKRLGVNSKVCLKKHKNITGVVVDSSDVGFNHWMVKWDRTGETVREYGSDLVVC